MNKQSFTDFFTEQLNQQQQLAVAHTQGPLLVIAGPGSGKTRVITARIVNLILNKHVDPTAIVALTFTNKAAREMQERIASFLPGKQTAFIGTFHSYCFLLLKKYSSLLNLETFSILDADDQQQLVAGIIKKAGLEKRYTARSLLYIISSIKNNDNFHEQHDQLIKEIFLLYEKERKASKCLDFDDLLLYTLELFEKNDDFRLAHQKRVRHVLVDEYQDTNVVQHRLLKATSLEQSTLAIDSVCAVGDEDQSIYSWRGATVANMLNFSRDFTNTQTITIEQNYRSAQEVLDLANHVINHNTLRTQKTLHSTTKQVDALRLVQCMSGTQEAELVATLAKALRNQKNNDYAAELAVLYRAHYQSRALEEALIRHAIPYVMIGGIQFYERKEIKDILAYLRLMINPHDRVSFFRVINCPLRGLGDAFVQEFQELWEQNPFYSFIDCAQDLLTNNSLTRAKEKALTQFLKLFEESTPQTPEHTMHNIVQKTEYLTYLRNAYDKEEANTKIDNVKELIRAAQYAQEHHNTTTIQDFLADVTLMQEKSRQADSTDNPIMLMTLHAAKGLEFNTVVISGLEEGILPSTRSSASSEQLEEERRLLYVGITRAKKRLLLSYARFRATFGTMTDQLPSRFIKEIPEHLVPRFTTAQWQEAHMKQFVNQWLGISIPSSVTIYSAARKESSNIASQSPSMPLSWKKNMPVTHPTFGIGIIKEVHAVHNKMFLTVAFRNGVKKIDASFVKSA